MCRLADARASPGAHHRGRMRDLVKVPLLVGLALAGGVGAAHASAPTFAVVAVVFVAGLWLLLREDHRAPAAASPVPEAPPSAPPKAPAPPKTLSARLVPPYLFCWWAAMVAPMASYTPLEVGARTVEATASGSLQNQVLVASFGMVGMLFLPAAARRIGRAFWWLMGLWGVYLLWGYVSLFWSVYPALTVRNLAAFALVTLGSFGLGAGFYGARPDGARVFFRHVVVGGFLSAAAILLPLPFHLGSFNPLDPTQRLEISGNLTTFASRPVVLAALTLVATSMLGLRAWRTRDWFGVIVLLLPIFVLKTRGPMLWAVLALAIVYLLCRGRAGDRIFQAGLLFVSGVGLYVLYAGGILASLVPFITRGNVGLSLTLTGRLPLWDALSPYVADRPLLGAGFSAFWNPDNLFLMERLVGFPVVSAHNGFLEELLNTGAIGLALFLTFWVCAMVVSVRRALRDDALGWMAFLFLVLYLFFNLTTSLMQEYLEVPFMAVFVLLGLMAVGPAREPPDPEPVTRPARARRRPVPVSRT
jgi:exopolysaccharide production protein ExoQ